MMAGTAFAFRSCTIPFQVAERSVGGHRGVSAGRRMTSLSKVPSLVFDIELEDTHPLVLDEEEFADVTENLRSLLRHVCVGEHQLSMDVHEALQDWCITSEMDGQSDSDLTHWLADELVAKGYRVSVRTAVGGGQGGECLRNLRHTFLCCMLPGKSTSGHFTVDPKFKEQFEIAHSTARYAAILREVPEVYVGLEDRLPAVVELLCLEMSRAFQQQENVLPPWRQASSMLSKWRPRRSMDNPPESRRRASSEGALTACYATDQPALAGTASGSKSAESWQPLCRYTGGDFTGAEDL